jgi:hypothetical protein
VGRSFAGAHREPAGRVAEQVRGLSGGLDHVGGSFTEAARRYREGDSAAETAIGDAAAGS